MKEIKQPAKAMKPTLARDIVIDYNGCKAQIACIQIFCPWLTEEDLRPVEISINTIMLHIMKTAEACCSER